MNDVIIMIENKDNQKSEKSGKVESLIIFRCNCRCIMCSTGLQIDRSQGQSDYHAIRPFADVKKDIDKAREQNAFGFAFSGGEATLRADLPDLVRYAREQGLDHIEVQSNGRIYANRCYAEKLIDAGVNNFVISLHAPDADLSDYIMGVPGAFAQTVQGIKNLNELGQAVKINIVLMKPNYQRLLEHVQFLLANFKIKEFRFTFVMLEGNVLQDLENIVPRMSEVAPYIAKAIELAKDQVACFVYNMAPCFLPDHVKYINDMGKFDTLLLGPEFETSLDDSRKTNKVKSAACAECTYNEKCDGIWKNYAREFGLDELVPINQVPLIRGI